MNPLSANTWLPSVDELQLFGPELILIGTIVAVLVVPLFVGRRPFAVALLALLGAVAGLQASGSVALRVAAGGQGALTPPSPLLLPPMLVADRFSAFFKMFLLLALVAIIWLWIIGAATKNGAGVVSESEKGQKKSTTSFSGPEFFVLLLTSALGMMLMVGTLNLLVIIVAIETASLPSYALVASDKRSRLGAEAALKYVMFGAASAAIMIYGVSLLYGRFGTLDLSTIAARIAAMPPDADIVFWLGLLAVGVGIAFKIAIVPLHWWCPDVFEGAPIEVTTWLSVGSKAAGLGLLLRIVDTLSASPVLADAVVPLTWAIGALAAITCTVGNLAALRQESVKRILAYSSIAHAGYMLMAGAILVGPAGTATSYGLSTNAGMAAVIAYLLVYVTMNVGAFGATALVVWQTGSDHLSSFTGLGRRAPWVAVPMAVCLFSLVGLPPLGGFAAKWFLLIALGKTAAVQPWLWGLVVVAVLNTALSLYYYVRIVRQMFLTEDAELPAMRVPAGGLVMVNACAVILLLLGTLWFSPLGQRAELLATGLFRAPAPVQLREGAPQAASPIPLPSQTETALQSPAG
jgi:NADH-quinone oxidoreductase subunit N